MLKCKITFIVSTCVYMLYICRFVKYSKNANSKQENVLSYQKKVRLLHPLFAKKNEVKQ